MKRISQSVRWRLGLRVVARELEDGTDESIFTFYNRRVTDCSFLNDQNHYEYPRANWIRERVSGGRLLEIGCGNGGMTKLLSPLVNVVIALDASRPSLAALDALGLKNVSTRNCLIENYEPDGLFEWVVLADVIEHLRNPGEVLAGCAACLTPGGTLLVTTPNGHWESDEHLHEFNLAEFCDLVGQTNLESIQAGYLRDEQNRRRWLVGEARAASFAPAADDFDDRRPIVRLRQR